MKKFSIIIAFLCSNFIHANLNLENDIVLPKSNKTLRTFSGDLLNNESFHLIFTKNKISKKYEVFSFLFDGNTVVALPIFTSETDVNIVSFHQNKEMLTLLLSYKLKNKSFLKKIDFNLYKNSIQKSDPLVHDDFLTSVRLNNRSILVYKNDNNYIEIADFTSSLKPVLKRYTFISPKDSVKVFFKDKSVSSINTNEFVPNGAVNDVRLYFKDNKLFFTRDSEEPLKFNIIGFDINSKKTNTTELLIFNLNNNLLSPQLSVFNNQNNQKYRKATSYVADNKLFQLALSKTEGYIKIHDINTNTTVNNFSLDESLSKYIKNNDEFIGLPKFLKNASKNKYNATLTVNKTTTDKLRLRIDYVDVTYNYNYNLWYHHQFIHQQFHNQFIQQNIQRSIPSGFGPNFMDDEAFLSATVLKQKRFFEVVLDVDCNLLEEDLPDSFYQEIDKEMYIDNLEGNLKFKFESSCFLKNNFRYIAYNIKDKNFVIHNTIIK